MKKRRLLAAFLALFMCLPSVSVSAEEMSYERLEAPEWVGNPGDLYEQNPPGNSGEREASETGESTTVRLLTEDELAGFLEEQGRKDEGRPSSFAEVSSDRSTQEMDFSSRELLVATEDPTVFTWDTEVISEYGGVYLTRYGTAEETRNAYLYYSDRTEFVSPNISFSVAEPGQDKDEANPGNDANPEDEANPENDANPGIEANPEATAALNQGDDAISLLNELVEESPENRDREHVIALIDTGVDRQYFGDLVDFVTLVDDDASDSHGHGTRMYKAMKEEYADARILSIKALDRNGKGKASDIYAAIQYAIYRNADVINLSMTSYSTAENEVIRNVIREAVDAGITVVGAAGNDGRDAKYYIPGSIEEAVIVGACTEKGIKTSFSNFGATVDCYVVAESTSEAAARYSALFVGNVTGSGVFSEVSPEENKEQEGSNILFEAAELNPGHEAGETEVRVAINGTEYELTVPEYIMLPVTFDSDSQQGASSRTSGFLGAPEKTEGTWKHIGKRTIPASTQHAAFDNDCGSYLRTQFTTDAMRAAGGNLAGFAQYMETDENGVITRSAAGTNGSYSYGKDTGWQKFYDKGYRLSVRDGDRYAPSVNCLEAHDEAPTGGAGDQFILYPVTANPGTDYANYYADDQYVYVPYRSAQIDIRPVTGKDHEQNFLIGAYIKVPVREYYAAIRKKDNQGNLINNVSFDVSVDGEVRSRALYTGYCYDWKSGQSARLTDKNMRGIGVLSFGKTKPGKVTVTENWNDQSEGQGQLWESISASKSSSVKWSDYAENHESRDVTVYESMEEAVSHADAFTWVNVPETIVPNPFYVAIHKVDDAGHLMKNVSFDIVAAGKLNGMDKTVRSRVSATSGIWTGWYVDLSGSTPRFTELTSENDLGITGIDRLGTAIACLGEWDTPPDVTIKENWDYDHQLTGFSMKLYKSTGEEVPEADYPVEGFIDEETSLSVTPFVSVMTAWNNRKSFTFINYPQDNPPPPPPELTPIFIAIKKEAENPEDGKMYPVNGVTFSIYTDQEGHIADVPTGFYYDNMEVIREWQNDWPIKTYAYSTAEDHGDHITYDPADSERTIKYHADGEVKKATLLRTDGWLICYVGDYNVTWTEDPNDPNSFFVEGWPTIYAYETKRTDRRYDYDHSLIIPEMVLGYDEESGKVKTRKINLDDYEIDTHRRINLEGFENPPRYLERSQLPSGVYPYLPNYTTIQNYLKRTLKISMRKSSAQNDLMLSMDGIKYGLYYSSQKYQRFTEDYTGGRARYEDKSETAVEPILIASFILDKKGNVKAIEPADFRRGELTDTLLGIDGKNQYPFTTYPFWSNEEVYFSRQKGDYYPIAGKGEFEYTKPTITYEGVVGTDMKYLLLHLNPQVSYKEDNKTKYIHTDMDEARRNILAGTFFFRELETNENYELNDRIYDTPVISVDTSECVFDIEDDPLFADKPVKMPYFAAVRKTDEDDRPINGVPFDLTVNGTTLKGSAEQGVITGSVYNYDNGERLSVATYRPGTGENLTDKVSFALTDKGDIIRKTELSRQDGVALIYLGVYKEAPSVSVKENWTGTAEQVTGKTADKITVIQVNASAFEKDPNTCDLPVTGEISEAVSNVKTIVNETNGSIRVKKLLTPSNIKGADPTGAEYTVTADEGQGFAYSGVCIIQKDGTSNVLEGLKKGRYSIVETKGPGGKSKEESEWFFDKTVYHVEITGDGGVKTVSSSISQKATQATVLSTDTHKPCDFYLSIRKSSSNPDYEPDMAGTAYGLYFGSVAEANRVGTIIMDQDGLAHSVTGNDNWKHVVYRYIGTEKEKRKVTVKGELKDTEILYLHLQSDGSVSEIPAGTFKLKEIRNHQNYELNEGVSDIPAIPKDEKLLLDAERVDVLAEKPVYGSIQVKKSLQPSDIPGASPAGAEYTVVAEEGQSFTYTGICRIKADGTSDILHGLQPGRYRVEETKAPDKGSWELDDHIYVVTIAVDGGSKILNAELVTATAKDATIESVDYARGDLRLVKRQEDGAPMAGVHFIIRNTESGESVEIVTDENGYWSSESSYALHSFKTNEAEAKTGCWFYGTGKKEMINDHYGAFPAGEYTVTEKNAKGKQKEDAIHVAVTGKGVQDVYDTRRTDDRKEITDMELPSLTSKAVILTEAGEAKEASPMPGLTVRDTVSYTNLRADTDYTLAGRLMRINKDGTLTEVKTGAKTFHTPASYAKSGYGVCGTAEMVFKDVDFSSAAGTQFIVFQRVYLGSPADGFTSYRDAFPDSNNDVVVFPLVHEDVKDKDQTITVLGKLCVHKILNVEGDPSGAEYTVKGVTDPEFRTVLSIGADGFSESVALPFGSYTVRETKLPSRGEWAMDGNTYTVEIALNKGEATIGSSLKGEAGSATIVSNEVARTFVTLKKRSKDETIVRNNPNYSLAGAEYQLFASEADAKEALEKKDYSSALGTWITDEDGNTDLIEVTDWMKGADEKAFYVVESAAARNYLRSTEITGIMVKKDNLRNSPACFIVEDEPVRVPAEAVIRKIDRLTGGTNTAKGKTLEGASFTIAYYASDITASGPVGDPVFTETFAAKKDEDYRISFSRTLPLGFLVIREIRLPEEYTKEGAEITADGKKATEPIVIRLSGTYQNDHAVFTPEYTLADGKKLSSLEVIWENTPIRGNIDLVKKSLAGEGMAGVEFEIKNKETGESHILVSDEKGRAATGTDTDSSVWFSLGEEGDIRPKDGFAALPLGTYIVTELRCAANEGYQLNAPVEVTLTADQPEAHLATAVAEEDGMTYFYNVPNPVIRTLAKAASTDSKTMPQSGEKGETILDTVSYDFLRENTTYTLVGTLMVADHRTGSVYAYPKDGKPYRITKSFTTEKGYEKSVYEKSGRVEMEFTDIYPENYEGCSFVVFEKLYYGTNTETADQYEEIEDNEIFPIEHTDIHDADQTVEVADIQTHAKDSCREHIARPEGTVTIVDAVSYTGLTVGETYTITGDLHVTGYTWKDADGKEIKNTETDEPLKDKEGHVITASETFTATTSAGIRELGFTVDADLLQGQSVVVFENLYYKEMRIAFHADLRDENQTIHFPNIHTTLFREGTEDWAEDFDENDITKKTVADEASREVMAAENAVVIDRIRYHNLLANRTYRIYGVLMDKTTGQKLVDADGKNVEVNTTFTTPSVDAVPDQTSPNSAKYVTEDGVILDMSADHGNYTVDGFVKVQFPAFDARNLANHTAVAFEEIRLLTEEGEILVAEHKDMDDSDQTVRFIEIGTRAEVKETKTQLLNAKGETTIIDTVEYHNVVPGKTYSMEAALVVSNDKSGYYKEGDRLKDTEGNEVKAVISFIPDQADGTIDVPVTFKGHFTPEMNVVCFETMRNEKGLVVAAHNSISDGNQTVYKMAIGTYATVDGCKTVSADGRVNVSDRVEYRNLIPGLTYEVTGVLIRKSDGREIMINEERSAAGSTTFTPDKANGFVTVDFPEFDASGLKGDALVVFEYMYVIADDGHRAMVAYHEDLSDEDQTITFPEIHTALYRADASEWAEDDSAREVMAEENAKVVDKVTYAGIPADSGYQLKGILMDKETGKPALDAEGKEIRSGAVFRTAASADGQAGGTADVIFTFDAGDLAGHTLVAYEELYLIRKGQEDILMAEHKELNDQDQTVRFIKIGTKAETETGTQVFSTAGETTVYDTVTYHNVKPGKEYTMTATLMVTGDITGYDQSGQKLTDAAGNVITRTVTFVPEDTDGTMVVPITFSGYLIPEIRIVAFETMRNDKGLTVAVHNDITDRDQTTYVVKIGTAANVNDRREALGTTGVIVNDAVMYSNAVPGLSYMIRGILMDKESGKPVVINGKEVTAEKSFVPQYANRYEMIRFPEIDATALRGKDIVVFEKMYLVVNDEAGSRLEYEVAKHEDLNDEGQTISFPEIGTSVRDEADGDRVLRENETASIIDTVTYQNLSPGDRYTVKGYLVYGSDGESVLQNGVPVTGEASFTPDAENGSVEVNFRFETKGMKENRLVVFEEIYSDSGELVGEHKDLTDENQTILIEQVSPKKKKTPKTGDDTPILFLLALMLSSVSCAVLVMRKKRKERMKQDGKQ